MMKTAKMLVIVACSLLAGARAQEKEFHGMVVDADGKPVAGAPVDTYWAVVEGKLAPRAGTRTDAEGRFQLRVRCTPRRPTPIMAVDAGVACGATAILDAEHPETEVVLRLVPLVAVHGEIASSRLAAPIEGGFVSIVPDQAIIALVGVSCGGSFALQLPPGDYRLSYHATDCVAAKDRKASVEAGAPEVDLGTIDLTPTVLSRLYGKTPPELIVSDARGVDRSVKLADYRGRWVLLEFWGFW